MRRVRAHRGAKRRTDAGLRGARGARLRLPAVVVLLATLVQSPSPTPEPVIELQRTAQAAWFGPRTANPLFILVIGSDVREGDPAQGRADSIHVVAVNTDTMHGTILGIPRDSWVDIPGHGGNKINAALHLGGPQKLVETVGNLTGMPIHYWAMVEFSRFRELVDRLGSIDVGIPYPMHDPLSGANFDPGLRRLNGAEALAFARMRYGLPGGDFGRSENHGRLLLAALNKFKAEVNGPMDLFRYLEVFKSLVTTSVPPGDMIHLGTLARRVDVAHVSNVVVTGGFGRAGSQSVVLLNPEANETFAKIRDDGML